MSVTATRTVTVTFSGDVSGVNAFEAPNNASSPGQIQYVDLTPTNNTILKPTGAVAVTIVPPVSNTIAITWKGSTTSDAGVVIHTTAPTSVGFTTALTQIVLAVSTTVSGVRLFWS